jgi:hypothetical protein
MADIRDWGKFLRGRWDWTSGGYETGFPRGCQFTDLDAAIEFDGRALDIETKHHDGEEGEFPQISWGQLRFLRNEVQLGKTAIILFGCGPCNDPQGVWVLAPGMVDRKEDWRGRPKDERRKLLKYEIDKAMGLASPADGPGLVR